MKKYASLSVLLASVLSVQAQTKPASVLVIRAADMHSFDVAHNFVKTCPTVATPVTDPAAADYVLHAATYASWLADRSGHVVFVTEAILPGSVVKDVCHFLTVKQLAPAH